MAKVPPTDRFPCLLSNRANVAVIEKINKKLSVGSKKMFQMTCLGHFLSMSSMQFQGVVYAQFLFSQDNSDSVETIKFYINNGEIEFGPREFALVTGLCFGPYPRIGTDRGLHQRIFKGLKSVLLVDIEKAFMSCTDDEDQVKLALLMVLGGILLPRGSTSSVKAEYIKLCDDLDAFNAYPWGRVAYSFLLTEIRRLTQMMVTDYKRIAAKPSHKVRGDANGFTYALLAWAYEAIPLLGEIYGGRMNEEREDIPRILRWKPELIPRLSELRENIFKDIRQTDQNALHIVLKGRLEPLKIEKESVWYKRVVEWEDETNATSEYSTPSKNEGTPVKPLLQILARIEERLASIETNSAQMEDRLKNIENRLCVGDQQEDKASQDEAVKQKEALVNEVACLRVDLQQTTCLAESDQIRQLQEQLSLAQKKLQLSDISALETIKSEFEDQKALILELKNRLADAEVKVVEGERVRKKLHNQILELKGNIRVFCRVRPLQSEDGVSAAKAVSFPTSTEVLGQGIDLSQNGQKHYFTFDKVFKPDDSQESVFVEISQLVQSALDGYKVCVFAYGQTGSGKTYTMMGKPEPQDQKGLIPRSLEKVFQAKQILESQGWKYEMKVSMLEIYNETIRDLLAPNKSGILSPRVLPNKSSKVSPRVLPNKSGKVSPRVSSPSLLSPKALYAIHHDSNGNTTVRGLTVEDCHSSQKVFELLERAIQSRSVSMTQMNEESSRSHFVFTLRIEGVNEGTDQKVQGVLNLIDLAGSERLSKSGSTGDVLKETQAINKSLSALNDAICALTKKELVPFRNSKLTFLLKTCLSGDSKVLMFVNISPEASFASESLCSLRFAARANACELRIQGTKPS